MYRLEILGFLQQRLRNQAALAEVYALLCDDVWRGLSSFRWTCSLRAWVYTLARHAEWRLLRADARRREHAGLGVETVSIRPQLVATLAPRPRLAAAAASRSAAAIRLPSRALCEAEAREPDGSEADFRPLRRRLCEDDQLLVQLHVDRQLNWYEIAYVMLQGRANDEAELQRETLRVRKRYELIRDRLRRWALEEGLL